MVLFSIKFYWKYRALLFVFLVFQSILGVTSPKSFAAQTGGTVGLDTTSYLSPIETDREPTFSSIHASFDGEFRGPIFESAIHANTKLSVDRGSYNFIEFPEAYFGTSQNLGPAKLSVGRKMVQWNHLDDSWGLGIWQPRFRWDYLNPQKVGLVGLFMSVDQPLFNMTLFGSPGFIPERGIPIDSSLHSESPWFLNPPPQIAIKGVPTTFRYRLDIPPISDIVAHPGLGIVMRLGGTQGFWGSAGYAYKPLNQLLIGFDGYYNHATGEGNVNLFPRVAYHQLASIETGFKSRRFNTCLSLLGERPLRDDPPATWTTQEITDSVAINTSVDVAILGAGAYATRLSFDYLRQWGGDAADRGEYGSSSASSFDSRYPFKDTVRLGLTSYLLPKLNAKSQFLYDIRNDGAIISTELSYHPRQTWVVTIGADILGSETSDLVAPDTNLDFIRRYRANDRVHGGITYVF